MKKVNVKRFQSSKYPSHTGIGHANLVMFLELCPENGCLLYNLVKSPKFQYFTCKSGP